MKIIIIKFCLIFIILNYVSLYSIRQKIISKYPQLEQTKNDITSSLIVKLFLEVVSSLDKINNNKGIWNNTSREVQNNLLISLRSGIENEFNNDNDKDKDSDSDKDSDNDNYDSKANNSNSNLSNDPAKYFKSIYNKNFGNNLKQISTVDTDISTLNNMLLKLMMQLKQKVMNINNNSINSFNIQIEGNSDNYEEKQINLNENFNSQILFANNFRYTQIKSKTRTKTSLKTSLRTKSKGMDDDPPEMYKSDVLCKDPADCLAKKLTWNK